jgi:tetratricopeptide (TPR) repeat protein
MGLLFALAPPFVLSGLGPGAPPGRLLLRLRGGDHQRGGPRPQARPVRPGGGRGFRGWQPIVPLYSIEGNTPQYRAAAGDAAAAHARVAQDMSEGKLDAALRLALDGAELYPEDQKMLFTAATLLERRGRQHEAVAKLEALIALNATHSGALGSLARIVGFKTELDVIKARGLAARAMEADPTSAEALSIAAQIEHYGAHDLSAAKQMYREILKHDPGHFAALTHLGKLLHTEVATGGMDRTRSVSASGRSTSVGDAQADSAEGDDEGGVWDAEGVEGAEQCFRFAKRAL